MLLLLLDRACFSTACGTVPPTRADSASTASACDSGALACELERGAAADAAEAPAPPAADDPPEAPATALFPPPRPGALEAAAGAAAAAPFGAEIDRGVATAAAAPLESAFPPLLLSDLPMPREAAAAGPPAPPAADGTLLLLGSARVAEAPAFALAGPPRALPLTLPPQNSMCVPSGAASLSPAPASPSQNESTAQPDVALLQRFSLPAAAVARALPTAEVLLAPPPRMLLTDLSEVGNFAEDNSSEAGAEDLVAVVTASADEISSAVASMSRS